MNCVCWISFVLLTAGMCATGYVQSGVPSQENSQAFLLQASVNNAQMVAADITQGLYLSERFFWIACLAAAIIPLIALWCIFWTPEPGQHSSDGTLDRLAQFKSRQALAKNGRQFELDPPRKRH